MADAATTLTEVADISSVQITQDIPHPVIQPALAHEVTIGVGRDRKAVGHSNTLRHEFAVHLAQRGVLTSNQRDVINARFGKPANLRRLFGAADHRNRPLSRDGFRVDRTSFFRIGLAGPSGTYQRCRWKRESICRREPLVQQMLSLPFKISVTICAIVFGVVLMSTPTLSPAIWHVKHRFGPLRSDRTKRTSREKSYRSPFQSDAICQH